MESLTQAIAADPKDYSLHFNLALAYSLMGKNADAIPEYKKTLELKPDLYQAELNLGISLLREKQPAEAVPYLTTAAAQNPKEYRPNYYLAAALLGAGDFAKAEQSYTAALAIDPKSPDAELGLAHALAGENKLEDAAAHFKKAAELNPAYRDDLLELAAMYETAKQPEQAIAIYQQFPDNPGAQERLGDLLLKAGQARRRDPVLPDCGCEIAHRSQSRGAGRSVPQEQRTGQSAAAGGTDSRRRSGQLRDPHAAWTPDSRSAQVSRSRRGV